MQEGHCLMAISEQHWYPSLRQMKGVSQLEQVLDVGSNHIYG